MLAGGTITCRPFGDQANKVRDRGHSPQRYFARIAKWSTYSILFTHHSGLPSRILFPSEELERIITSSERKSNHGTRHSEIELFP